MYRPQPEPFDRIILDSRQRTGARLVPTDTRGVRALLAALKRGEMIGILPDRPARNGSVYAEFFGYQVSTPVLAPKLVARTGAPVIYAMGERLPWGRGYRLHFLRGPEEIGNPDERVAARALNQGIEQCIRLLPEQYWWSYKRFGDRPPGEKNRYPKTRRYKKKR